MDGITALQGEQWKPVKGFEGLYEVSNLGRVASLRRDKVLKPRKMPSGYLRVHIPLPNWKRDAYVHRLVAEAFCAHPQGCDVVNHIDNNTQNNRADNLEWTTQLGNVTHARMQGRTTFPAPKAIIATKDGVETWFRSISNAAATIGITHGTIRKAYRSGRKTYNGYYWRLA